MSALGEGPHKVGIDIARIPPAADTWVLAKRWKKEAAV